MFKEKKRVYVCFYGSEYDTVFSDVPFTSIYLQRGLPPSGVSTVADPITSLLCPEWTPFPFSPLSGGNNSNDFPENQLTIDVAFFAILLGRTLLYHRSPCPDIVWGNKFGGKAFPHRIFGGTAFPRIPTRLHHWSRPQSSCTGSWLNAAAGPGICVREDVSFISLSFPPLHLRNRAP